MVKVSKKLMALLAVGFFFFGLLGVAFLTGTTDSDWDITNIKHSIQFYYMFFSLFLAVLCLGAMNAVKVKR